MRESESLRHCENFPMDIFSANPKSFKLHRKSHLALKLKSSISVKLLQFLADYRDDVLAEYVTVLVCNGKHQYQAKEDLEAFLGDRTVEFVSWLWNLLMEYVSQSSTDAGLLYLDEVSVCPPENDRCKATSTDRCGELQSLSPRHADELLMKDDKTYHMSTCDPVSSKDMKLEKGSQRCLSFSNPLSKVNTEKAFLRTSRNENINCEVDRRTQCITKINQILNHESSGLPKEISHLPEREAGSKNTQFVISGCPCPNEICASRNVGSSLPPKFVGAGSVHSEKPRASVWDRLGKPCESISVGHTHVDSYGVGHKKQDGRFLNQLPLMPLKTNPEVFALGERSYSYPVQLRKLEHGYSAVGKPYTANNIGRKRLFGELSTGPGTHSVSLTRERNMDQCKDISHNLKKANLNRTGLKTTEKLVSEVLDVKQRLHQIEMEMSKLQSKKVEMEKKDGKINHLSNSGTLKDSENIIEIESRTVLVTNVHFSATKEALTLYFAKCGMVVSVVILTDIVTARPKGFIDNSIIRSAYITFASKESVDKAVALSGTTFYSRTVKVLRKAQAASAVSSPTQLAGRTFHAHSPHVNRKATPNKPRYLSSSLQWRRDPSTDPSEPSSAPASAEGVSPSAPKNLSDSHAEENTSSVEPPDTECA